ncbi:hypothetical protein BURPS1106B_A0499 [Burkholderia pseudomallei 1106b]|nr:hypothetical protein BURPS1106B_A0499 [Burkholderia pseudomallei 1106b]
MARRARALGRNEGGGGATVQAARAAAGAIVSRAPPARGFARAASRAPAPG